MYRSQMAGHGKVNSTAPVRQALAHELNNELGIIIAECDLLESTLKDDGVTFRRIKMIRTSARRIADRISAGAWPGPPPKTK